MKDSKEFIPEAAILLKRALDTPDAARFMTRDASNQWIKVSWREFLANSISAAYYLSQCGIGVGSKVAIFAKNRIEWPFCTMAIHALRAVFVPVYQSNTPAETGYIVSHSDAEVLITEPDLLPVVFRAWEKMSALRKIIVLGSKNRAGLKQIVSDLASGHGMASKPEDKPEDMIITFEEACEFGQKTNKTQPVSWFEKTISDITKEDVATILYTSGTTGPPKGVVLTLENLYVNAGDWIDVLSPLIPETRVDLLWLPISHIFGWGEMGLGNTLGFTTYMTTPIEVLTHMPVVKPTIFISVPAYWEKLYLEAIAAGRDKSVQIERLRQQTGGRLQFCLSGGAGLKKEVKEFFLEAGLLLIEGYGLTECSPTLTMNSKDDYDFDTVGKPFPNVQLTLASDGEILAKGKNVFSMYYKNRSATEEAFTGDGWFLTGDIGAFTERGFLKILGRKKEIIVTSGGKNISPQLIEAKFREDPYIEQIVLYGDERKYLTALVTLREDAVSAYAKSIKLDISDFHELVRASEIRELVNKSIVKVNAGLASFETIKNFYIHDGHLTVTDGFLTPSLKLKRRVIHDRFKDNLDALYV